MMKTRKAEHSLYKIRIDEYVFIVFITEYYIEESEKKEENVINVINTSAMKKKC